MTPDPDSAVVAPRPRSARGSGVDLRADLLAATAAVLDEIGGTAAITIRRVAEACGVSQAAIYPHFASRDELVHDLAWTATSTSTRDWPRSSTSPIRSVA